MIMRIDYCNERFNCRQITRVSNPVLVRQAAVPFHPCWRPPGWLKTMPAISRLRSGQYPGWVDVPDSKILPWAFILFRFRFTPAVSPKFKVVSNMRQKFMVGDPLVFLADALGFICRPPLLVISIPIEVSKPLNRPSELKHAL